MALRSGTEHIDRWPDVASAADLYNVAASPNSSAFVQAGDREHVAGEGVYECVDPTVGAAVWRLVLRDVRPTKIVVGNELNDNTIFDCDILDPGDGSGVAAAVLIANANPSLGFNIRPLEGTYAFLPANRFTLPANATMDAVDASRVTFVCPAVAGQSQNLAQSANGSRWKNLTIALVGLSTAAAAADADFYALFLENGVSVENVAVTVDNSGSVSPVLAGIGGIAAATPSDITIKGCSVSVDSATGVFVGVLLDSSLASVGPVTSRPSIEDFSFLGAGTSGNRTAVSCANAPDIRRLRHHGPGAALSIGVVAHAAGTYENVTIEDVSTDHASAIADQGHSLLTFTRAAGTVAFPNIRIANMRFSRSITGDAMRTIFTGVVADDMIVDGVQVTGTPVVADAVEIRIAGAATTQVRRALFANIRTPGTFKIVSANPSTDPVETPALSNIAADTIALSCYANDAILDGCSAGTIVIANVAERTRIDASTRFSMLTDNGQSTVTGIVLHTSTTPPTVNDDDTQGYRAGDEWFDDATDSFYRCSDATSGAAVWTVSAPPVSGAGTAVVNFGAAPGSSTAEVNVAGQVGFTAASHAEAWLQGDTTATHNAYEHLIVPMVLRIGNQAAGSFTIYASTDWRLDGTFTVHWTWRN